jgi:transcriptional regulator
MPEYNNGHDAVELDELAGRDAARIQAREPIAQSITVTEKVEGTNHSIQQAHDLMIKSADQMLQHWSKELARVRDNTKVVEQMMIEAVAKTKHIITEMHLLGAAVTAEVKRGEDVCDQLSKQLIQKIMSEQRP